MNWQEVDIRNVIEEVAEIQSQRNAWHTLVLKFEPEQIIVEIDPEKFANVLHNLLSNAIKYSPDGGEIQVVARLEAPNKQYPSGALCVQIMDQGLGINTENLKRLNSGKLIGNGIGLYLIQNLVEAHHGAFCIESEGEGKGTTVYVRIPVKQPEADNLAASGKASI
jgi:signal transduction histidine kinase